MDFKNIPKKYRPVPFWSWNEKLDPEETARQVEIMDKAGMGGFFMHARGGLQTEYMGEEWFENVDSAVSVAKEKGMYPWAYDENGWPSGFGDGKVNGLGVEYQQKYLRMEDRKEHEETAICKNGNHWFYYDVNPFYVDTLDEKVIKEFIKVSYEPYYEKYKGDIEGFFTDEPQVSRKGIPWSFVFEKEYKNRYGENILEHLEELFVETGEFKDTRFKFWKMVTDLFSKAYMKQLYDWCQGKGLKLTGHLTGEESIEGQLTSHGACMPNYEYFHIPGMDWLGRDINDGLIVRQLASAAAQMGKDTVLSETFALCGHNVSFDELKGIYEWQMVRGVNLLCQHLEGYSIRGIRKRDYPPALFYQQPWWEHYDKFIDAVSRIGMILNEGQEKADTLVIHPMSSAWINYNTKDFDKIRKLNEDFLGVIKTLEKKHVQFHLGDETVMEKHGAVKDGFLVIGKMKYNQVVIPPNEILFDSTKKLLDEFVAQGGKILSACDIEENKVTDNENITYTVRYFDDFKVHYFVNSTPEKQEAKLFVDGDKLNIYTGELEVQENELEFEPWGSLVLVENGNKCIEKAEEDALYVYPDGEFEVCGKICNALTLDRCDYYFDGVLQEKDGYVLNIAERANALGHKIAIKQDYHVDFSFVPGELFLVCEKAENFEITVNGQKADKKDCGFFADASFRKIDISKYVKKGENIITFECDFVQSEEFYNNLSNAYIFESEKNKLAYDMEIEAVYLVGDFSVRCDGTWTDLDRNAQRYKGGFAIDEPKKKITLTDIQKQGYPFFCGSLTVQKEFEIGDNTVLKFNRKGINAVALSIGDKQETIIAGKDEINLSKLAPKGRQIVKITLTNNLRNLLGPHHLEEGDSYRVSPASFFKEECIWNLNMQKEWNDDYCFIQTGIN